MLPLSLTSCKSRENNLLQAASDHRCAVLKFLVKALNSILALSTFELQGMENKFFSL